MSLKFLITDEYHKDEVCGCGKILKYDEIDIGLCINCELEGNLSLDICEECGTALNHLEKGLGTCQACMSDEDL